MTTDNYQLDTDAANSDLTQANSGGAGRTSDNRLFKFKPFKDKQVYTNKLFVALISPRAIPGFDNYPLDHRLFYVKLFGHYVAKADNAKQQEFMLCKSQMNKHAADLAKDKNYKMFEDDRCAYCEEAQVVWDQYTARWAELGYPDKESKSALSKEDYKAIANEPQLLALKQGALIYQYQPRYALPVYDLEQQPLAKGYQWAFAAETIFKGLMELVRVGVRFYSLNPHASVEGAVEGSEIFVGKDTTAGVRFCEYTVQDNRAPLALAAEEVVYLKDQNNLPPLLDLVSIWDYEKQLEVVRSGVAVDGDSTPPPVRAAVAPRTSVAAPVQARPAVVARPQPVAAPAPRAAVRPTAPVTRTLPPAGASVTPPVSVVPPPVETVGETAGVPPAAATRAATPPAGGQAPRPRRTW